MSSSISRVDKTLWELRAFKCWLSKRQIMEFSQFALVLVFPRLVSSYTNARLLFPQCNLIGGLRQRALKGRTVKERSD